MLHLVLPLRILACTCIWKEYSDDVSVEDKQTYGCPRHMQVHTDHELELNARSMLWMLVKICSRLWRILSLDSKARVVM